MNELLTQFLADGDDLLTQVDNGLLRLERDPGDADTLNEVFRVAHTFKGSSGLFDFPELTRLTHAAEDLLDAIRGGKLALDAVMTDDLLATFDMLRGWLLQIAATERLPAGASGQAAGLIARLRAPLGEVPLAEVAHPDQAARSVVTAPGWLADLGSDWLASSAHWLTLSSSTMRFVRYVPEADCFFRGDDPLYMMRLVPAIERLTITPPASLPSPADYDEYVCELSFTLATRAAANELDYLFRYVPEQVEIVEVDGRGLTDLMAALAGPAEDAETWAGESTVPIGSDRPHPERMADVRELLGGVLRTLAALPPLAVATTGPRIASAIGAVRAAALALGASQDLGEDAEPAAIEAIAQTLLADCGARPAAAEPAASGAGATAGQPGPDAASPAEPRTGGRVLKVDYEKVDRLMDLVGELTVAKNGLTFLAVSAEEEKVSRLLVRRIKDQYAVQHRIAEELQTAVMDIRMLPMSVTFARFPRLVRDLSRQLGRSVELVVEGEETMADKDVIEALGDPLMHLVRNCVDHGIEPPAERLAAGKPERAEVRLAAHPMGDAVLVEVVDDGRGIDSAAIRRKAYASGLISEVQAETISDEEAIDLVFAPGLSTAATISDVSGRGVGMDAVRTSVERLGGAVSIRSSPGTGTVASLRMPLTMAVTQVMVVSIAGQRFGVPVDVVAETVRVAAKDVDRVLHQDVLVLRGEVLPMVDLAEALSLTSQPPPESERRVLVVQSGGSRVGMVVERFHREVDVILKPLEGLVADNRAFAGTALLGDGLVLLVLNIKEVLAGVSRTA